MSKSQLACAIGSTESAFVRIKTSGSDGYIITACKTIPVGTNDLEGKKTARGLKKLLSLTEEWKDEALALCFCPEAYFPLNAYFPSNAARKACEEQCRIEAAHFLNRPEEYLHDHTAYSGCRNGEKLEKHLVLFYRAEPFTTLSAKFAERHTISFCGSPLLPSVHRSRCFEGATTLLDLEKSHVVLTVMENGQLEYFNFHRVKNRKEAEYFAIHELQSNPLCRNGDVQATGPLADRAMTSLLEKETLCNLVPPAIPKKVEFAEKESSACRSSTASKAIITALMAFEN
ncbi:MAG: hypothetical protein K9G39_07785 [Chlorobium sp.]|uniref:hypothetical protein n=1 Tax=Chlorobium sp. TaxID=1095 RepID=UPI0025C01866|nr:hypothetical protein [Chlorobium sp.]MCF8383474.1 hypothetical protein [Chlorobium sp.]